MIWLTWRQFRVQAFGAVAAVAAFAALMIWTGRDLAHLYASSGLPGCAGPGCTALATNFLNEMRADAIYPALFFIDGGLVLITPALIGLFWGAPLIARELEAGTFKLVWNQGVTRIRWAIVKLGLIGLFAMAVAGSLSLLMSWWSGPIDRAGGFPVSMATLTRFSPLVFATRGIAPVGYAAFAFALGVTAGVLIGRLLPAMAVALAVFVVAQIIVPTLVRPHLLPPARATAPVTVRALNDLLMTRNGEPTVAVNIPGAPVQLLGAWVVSNHTVTEAGQVYLLPPATPCQSGTALQCDTWIAGRHLTQVVRYQPASRYWAFQGYETGIYLALALGLGGCCLARVRRLS